MKERTEFSKGIKALGMGMAIMLLSVTTAWATNGMRVIGVGPTQRSMGGASVGLPLDAASVITNPAGIIKLDPQVNFGASLFTPKSSIDSVSYAAPQYGTDYTSANNSDAGASPMPAFGMVLPGSSDNLRIGVGGYGVAGMGVDYAGAAVYNMPAYSNYSMMKFAPAVAYKMGDLALGVAYNISWATMAFQAAGNQAANSSGQLGAGFTLGALYEMGKLTFGAAYESKQDFKSFKFNGYGCPTGYQEASMDGGVNYRCWAADGSGADAPKEYLTGTLDMDQPPVMTVGVGYTDNQLKVAADISIIQWSETIGKDSPTSTYANYVWNMNWADQTVFKLGMEYSFSDDFQFRAGYNYGSDPTDHDRAFETLMFPGVVETHYTLGASFKTGKQNVVNVGYMMVPKKSVSGGNAMQGITGYETSLSESSLEIGISSIF
jgi:long-chain fatty acid transport protein